jgi:hypothetical protein
VAITGSTASGVLTGPFRAGKAVPVGDGSEMTFLLANRDDYGYTSTASDLSFDESHQRQILSVPQVQRPARRSDEPAAESLLNGDLSAADCEDLQAPARQSNDERLLDFGNDIPS